MLLLSFLMTEKAQVYMKNNSHKLKISYDDLLSITLQSMRTITGIEGVIMRDEYDEGTLRGMILHWYALASMTGISREILDEDMEHLRQLAGIAD